MNQLNIPSKSHLIYRDNLIKAVQELYENVNTLAVPKAAPSPFKSSWKSGSSDTITDFCTSVYADADAVVGMSFLGELECSDLPASLVNGEARVDVVGEESNRILLITLVSTTTSPYHWEYTYPLGATWRSWELQTI